MSKARDLADSVSTGGILEDGAVSVSEISDLTVTAAELNNVAGVNSDVQTQLDLKAPLADPSFTGNVGVGTNSAARKLQVESDSNRVVSVKHTDGSSAYVTFSDNATTDDGQVRIGAVGNDLVGIASSLEGMRLTSTGLGIGTNSPARSLQVDSTNNRVASFRHTDGSSAYVTFSDSSTTDDGSVRIGAIGDDLVSLAGGLERMRINSNGTLLVGQTTASTSAAGSLFTQTGKAYHIVTGDTPLFVDRKSDDGQLVEFRRDQSVVGSIGSVASNYLSIGTGDTGILFQDDNDFIEPCNVSTASGRDAAIDLGTATGRFKDLYLSGSAYVGDNIYHDGDTTTYINFATGRINLAVSSFNQVFVTSNGMFLEAALKEDYDALSGTSPTCNLANGGAFSLSMSGNTTFTFNGLGIQPFHCTFLCFILYGFGL